MLYYGVQEIGSKKGFFLKFLILEILLLLRGPGFYVSDLVFLGGFWGVFSA